MISRRRFLTAVAIALAPIGAAAHAQQYKAQQAGKVPVVGVLNSGFTGQSTAIAAFRSGLIDVGLVEGCGIGSWAASV